MTSFSDHFSSVAGSYARYRPRYPPALFAYLASLCTSRDRAWDAATGNGQAAIGLADHFAHVVASDASASQIAHALAHPRVVYRVAAAEASGLEAASIDLVTVAQAMHWLDADRFFAEVRRVLFPGAVIAIWAYQALQVGDSRVQHVVHDYTSRVVGDWWPPERHIVDDGYRSLRFPFVELAPPAFDMHASCSMEELAGYIGTWSATRRYRQGTGRDPIPSLLVALDESWPAGEPAVSVRWPLAMRVGRAGR
jgi:SAM-dependent methyltransferase